MLTTTIDFIQSDYNSNMPIFGTPGSYGGSIPGLSTVGVFVSVAFDVPIYLALNNSFVECITTPGYVEFTNIDLSTNANITITMDQQGTACQ
jgi:hypothetical protein